MSEPDDSAETGKPIFRFSSPPISKEKRGLPLSRARALLIEHAACDEETAERILVKHFGEPVLALHYHRMMESKPAYRMFPEYGCKILPSAVQMAEFYKLLEHIEPGAAASAIDDAESFKDKGGRPEKYKWLAIEKVVAQMVKENRVAETFEGFAENLRAELKFRQLGEPSENVIRVHLGATWRVLKKAGLTNSVFKDEDSEPEGSKKTA